MNRENDEAVYEHPPEGPWQTILRARDRTIFFPRRLGDLPRTEWRLPSGAIVVNDLREGSVVRIDWRGDADLRTFKPKGRSLRDRGIIQRQDSDRPWFKFWYVERYDENDQLADSTLRLIEVYCGRTQRERFEFAASGEPLLVAGG